MSGIAQLSQKLQGVTGIGPLIPMAMGYREKGGWNVHSAQHNLVARIQDGGWMLPVLFPGLVPWIRPVERLWFNPERRSSYT